MKTTIIFFLLLITAVSYSQQIRTNQVKGLDSIINSKANYNTISDSSIYVSNYGNDANNGYSRTTAKKTLAAAQALANTRSTAGSATPKILIEAGSIFKEYVLPTADNITYNTYNLNDVTTAYSNKTSFPILEGADVYNTGWSLASGQTYTYTQAITSNLNNFGGYGEMLVVEIDTALEKTQPFTARHYLTVQSSIANAEANAGSSYTGNGVSSPTTLYIHPSNNLSPNSNTRYRYEVSVRKKAIDANASGAVGYVRDNMVYKNLYVRGFGSGEGGIASGFNSTFDRIIFEGGAIHNHIIASGSINNSLFIGGSDGQNQPAVVYYAAAGTNAHNVLKNTIFLNNYGAFATHTSGGSSNTFEINNVYVWPHPTLQQAMFFANNVDTTILNNVYVDGHYQIMSNVGVSPNNFIRNSIFINMQLLTNSNPNNHLYIDNCLFKSRPTGTFSGIQVGVLSTKIKNTIIHSKGANCIGNNTRPATVTNSILIGETPTGTFNPSWHQTGDVMDYNIYIRAGAATFAWLNSAGALLATTLSAWQSATGVDANSKYIDCYTNGNGLKDVFVDPDNGNYTLVNGGWGDSIRAWQTTWGQTAGMITPPSKFLQRPTREQAADLIQNGNVPNLSDFLMKGSTALPYNITNQGNSFNGNSQLVKTTSDGKLPVLDATNLTGVVATGVGTLASDLALTNSTAATSSVQQNSPSIFLTGQGWKTAAGAASQPVAYKIYNAPVFGTTAPTSNLTIQSSVNGGAYGGTFTFGTTGAFGAPSIAAGSTVTATTFTASTGITSPSYSTSSTPAAVSTDGYVTQNTNSTLAIPVRYSLRSRWSGTAWNTTTGATQTADFIVETQPVSSATPITSKWVVSSQIAAGGYNARLTLQDDGKLILTNTIRHKGYTVATLPAGTVGDEAYVTDATAPTYLGTLTGGGAIVTPVFYNGTAWVSH